MILEKEVLPGFDNIEEILPQKTREQIIHFSLSVDVSEYPSDTDVDEQDCDSTK